MTVAIKNYRSQVSVITDFMNDAPIDLEGMAKALGLPVKYDGSLPDDVSGMIERMPSGQFKITVNGSHHPNRQRFTLAHEISHYLLHRDLIESGVVDNAMYRSSTLSDDLERQANRFAAGIVMPADLVKKKWTEGLRSSQSMAAAFRVSLAAAKIRMDELNLGRGFAFNEAR